MFEDFSFSSPSSSRPPRLTPTPTDDDKSMADCDSNMISPMSSRCPSPRSFAAPRFPRSRSLYFRSPQPQQPQQPPTSVPFSAYDKHRLSIGTLTKKLHEHSIQTENTSCPASPSSPYEPQLPTPPRSSFPFNPNFPGYVLTPPDTDLDDEGYASPISPSLSGSGSVSGGSPTSLSPSLLPTPTSAPLDFCPDFLQPKPAANADPPTSASAADAQISIRTRRQHISRLQGQYTSSDIESIRRALLAAADEDMRQANANAEGQCGWNFNPGPLLSEFTEACHPSSLPPTQGPRRRRTISLQRSRVRSPVSPEPTSTSGSGVGDTHQMQMRRKSMCTTSTASSSRIEKNYHSSSDRDRERCRGRKKSEAGLRRKSLVSAALASMIGSGESI
ncbi:uncharacterized protein DSM5745_09571 [Aspergillus mulundensis]|uniref:Uncharacterized protein n=1 Tax=Aspergillus mulundensis TaxID=1810919 RepID=A0A3D8QVM8_9EURO|nr:Uncharacterized protein DSM5745_09571 [Aspergillus mulundensis]RDW65832.1 Uncharacterized protein DSM5745_09571 [Aspergillus mulundensis]